MTQPSTVDQQVIAQWTANAAAQAGLQAKLRNLVEGRTIACVGNGPTACRQSRDLDDFDIVLRFNVWQSHRPDKRQRIGRRCDLHGLVFIDHHKYGFGIAPDTQLVLTPTPPFRSEGWTVEDVATSFDPGVYSRAGALIARHYGLSLYDRLLCVPGEYRRDMVKTLGVRPSTGLLVGLWLAQLCDYAEMYWTGFSMPVTDFKHRANADVYPPAVSAANAAAAHHALDREFRVFRSRVASLPRVTTDPWLSKSLRDAAR